MKTLKLALLATTAAGAVTAGGFAYATVGNSGPADGKKAAHKVAEAADHAKPALPSSVPTCLPAVPKGKHAAQGKHRLPKPAHPSILPSGKPSLPKPPVDLPSGKPSLPKPPVDLPSDLPTCAPGSLPTTVPTSVPKTVPSDLPTNVPSLPNLPAPKTPSCSDVPAVIKREGARTKDITLPNGLRFVSAGSYRVTIKSRKVCVLVQKWAEKGGRFLAVERLAAPPQTTLAELAAALKLPQGRQISLGGTQTWQSTGGNGMIWFSHEGGVVCLTGSSSLSAQLPAIAAQLRRL